MWSICDLFFPRAVTAVPATFMPIIQVCFAQTGFFLDHSHDFKVYAGLEAGTDLSVVFYKAAGNPCGFVFHFALDFVIDPGPAHRVNVDTVFVYFRDTPEEKAVGHIFVRACGAGTGGG